MSEQDQQNPNPGDPEATGGDVNTATDPAQPENPGDSPTTYGDGATGDAEAQNDPVSAPLQQQPDDVPVADDPAPDDDARPVWNVETHGKPDPEQAEFYRVING